MPFAQLTAFPYHAERILDPHHQTITTPEAFESLMQRLGDAHTIAYDTETSGLSWWRHARICGTAFAVRDGSELRSFYVPFRHATGECQLEPKIVIPPIGRILADPKKTIICHNIKFDDHMSRREGWSIAGMRDDTMVRARLFDENQSAELKHRALIDLKDPDAHLHEELLDRELVRLAKMNGLPKTEYRDRCGYSQIPIHMCGLYASHDAEYTYRLHEKYAHIPASFPRIYATEMKLTKVLCDMEEAGVPIDTEYLSRLRTTLGIEKIKIEAAIWDALGHHQKFALSEDDQLRWFLETRLRLKLWKRTRGGKLAVDREVLEHFAEEAPVLKRILDWREANKLETTYTDSILEKLDENNVLHGDFQQLGTETARMSCRAPNLQNLPSDDDDRAKAFSGKKLKDGGIDPWSVRRAFVNRAPGWVRLYFDFSQIELRVLAHYTKDRVLTEAYLRGEDIHTRTSLEVFGTDDPARRRMSKVINFGLCIAEGQRVLTNEGSIPIEAVQQHQLLWDGVAWVRHDGLVYRGEREVISYDGVTATPNHQVFTEDGAKAPFALVAQTGRCLAVGAVAGVPARYVAFDRCHENEKPDHEVLRGHLFDLQRHALATLRERCFWEDEKLPLSEGQVQRSASAYAGAALRRYGAALRTRYARLVGALQGAWDPGALRLERALCSMGARHVSGLRLQAARFRPDQQRWALRARESSARFTLDQSPQPTKSVPVYDILNAGPRHRFTVEGKIVSNSYGLSPIGFARQARVSEAEAEKFYERFHQRYAGIPTFRQNFWNYVRRNRGSFLNLFGRARHVPSINSPIAKERARGERQAIGALIQGTAAELSKESLVRIDEWLSAEKIPARICQTVHDEIQIDVPVECFARVASCVKVLMEHYPELAPIPIVTDVAYSSESWADKRSVPGFR